MTVCYFGIFDENYNRNKVLIFGLKENGVDVIFCQSRQIGLFKYFELVVKHWKIRNKYDFMIVAFPGHQCMILARLLTRKKIFFDAFVSLYDSLVFDRGQVKKNSFKARYYFLLDFFSCSLADKILLDTNAHVKYFIETFKLNKDKFIRVFVGSHIKMHNNVKNDECKPKKVFTVHFHGNNIPLQGVGTIIKAADLLTKEDVMFNIVGPISNDVIGVHQNINFIDSLAYSDLVKQISVADVCLGIFGQSDKAQRVIPNKVFEALAMGKPIITGDSPAARELLINGENVLFCDVGDHYDLAQKILLLKNNVRVRQLIAMNGFDLFSKILTPRIIVKSFLKNII